jgi:hypothetical protein
MQTGGDDVLVELAREGLVTLPLAPGRELSVEHPRGEKLETVVAELDADREERGDRASAP